jgi:PilZ domain-containing protein
MPHGKPNAPNQDQERRHSPRFSCAGDAKIICLPSDGIFLPGTIRDLSLGGCCIQTISPLECGARAEVLMHVNTSSIRAVSQVRAIRDSSAIGMEFLLLSASGRDLLAELITQLARLQALTNTLRSERREIDPEWLFRQLQRQKLRAVLLTERFPAVETSEIPRPPEAAPSGGQKTIVEAEPAAIDLLI